MNRAIIQTVLSVFILLSSQSSYAQQQVTKVPQSWAVLPEDRTASNLHMDDDDVESINYARKKTKKDTFQELLNSTASSLDKYQKKKDKNSFSKNKWGLDSLTLKVSTSVSGMLGALFGRGKTSTELDFERTETLGNPKEKNKKPTTSFKTSDSIADVEAKIEPIMAGIVATGKVKNPSLFRRNFREQVIKYHKLFQNASFEEGQQWKPSSFYVFLRFSIGGSLTPNVSLSTGVYSMLLWFIDTKKATIDTPKSTDQMALQSLVKDFTTLMDRTDDTPIQESNYYLRSISFTLGAHGGFMVGDKMANWGVNPGVSFTRKKKRNDHFIQHEFQNEYFTLGLSITKKSHLDFARQNKISFKQHTNRKQKYTTYKIPTKKLLKGMKKAIKIGSFFADRGHKLKSKKWYINQIETKFTLSMTGMVGMRLLGGSTTIKFKIRRKHGKRRQ